MSKLDHYHFLEFLGNKKRYPPSIAEDLISSFSVNLISMGFESPLSSHFTES